MGELIPCFSPLTSGKIWHLTRLSNQCAISHYLEYQLIRQLFLMA